MSQQVRIYNGRPAIFKVLEDGREEFVSFLPVGREYNSGTPVSFPLDYSRRVDFFQRQRDMIRQVIEDMKRQDEVETFAEANDFDVEDDYDDHKTDFELDDDDSLFSPSEMAASAQRQAAKKSAKTATAQQSSSLAADSRPEADTASATE